MMKEMRYSAKGMIQSNGTGAMFSVRWLVMARRRIEGQAASPIHVTYTVCFGGAEVSRVPAPIGARLFARHAKDPHAIAKQENRIDHNHACQRVGMVGSTAIG